MFNSLPEANYCNDNNNDDKNQASRQRAHDKRQLFL